MASPSRLTPAEGLANNPSTQPPPRSGEGEQEPPAPPLRFGEGAGGRGVEPPGSGEAEREQDVLLVGGPDPAAADYAPYAGRGGSRVRSLILFLKPRLTDRDRADLDALIRLAGERRGGRVR